MIDDLGGTQPIGEEIFGPPPLTPPGGLTAYPNLLPPNSFPMERAIAGPTGRLDNAVPVPIDLLEQPLACPSSYLPWLAWYLSLDLWDWTWPDTTRRAVIARAVELNRLKGTAEGLRQYVEVMGSRVTQIVVPPQEFYIGQPLTKDQWNAWIRSMPEIRIELIRGSAVAPYDMWLMQDTTLDLSQFDDPTDWVWQAWNLGSGDVWFVESEWDTQAEAEARVEEAAGGPQYMVSPELLSGSPPSYGNEYSVWQVLALGSGDAWSVVSTWATQEEADSHAVALTSVIYQWAISFGPSRVPPPSTQHPLGGAYTLTGQVQFGFIDNDFILPDEGSILYARRVVEVIDGVNHPLQVVEEITTTQAERVVDINVVHTVGSSTMGFFVGQDYVGDDAFIDSGGSSDEVAPQIYTVQLDSNYNRVNEMLGLTMVVPSLTPINVVWDQNSQTAPAGPYCYLDDFFMGAQDVQAPASGGFARYPEAIIPRSTAGELIADSIFLLDPSQPTPTMGGLSFIGVSRLGMPAYRAEVMVDLQMKSTVPFEHFYMNDGFINDSFINDLDTTKMDRAIYAIRASKAVRDTIMVSFASKRKLTPSDALTPQMSTGDWVPASL